MTQNAPEQMFLLGTYCSCQPAAPILLHFDITHANTFSNRFHCSSLYHYHHQQGWIFVHTFCHHLPSVNAVNETSMKWSAEELHWPVLLWRYFSFFDQRELHLISFTLKTGTKILPPIPAIEGSVKQDLSLFVQIIFYICSDFFLGPCMFNEHCSFWWYHHLQHYVLISLTICWDFYLNIWWKGSALRTTAAATDKRLGHMFKCLCLYFTPNIVKLLSLHWLFNVTGVETILHR